MLCSFLRLLLLLLLKTLPCSTSSNRTTIATGSIPGTLVALSPRFCLLVVLTTYVKEHRPQGQNKVSVPTILPVPTRPTCAARHTLKPALHSIFLILSKVNKTRLLIGKFTKIAITRVLIGQSTCLSKFEIVKN